MNRYAAAVLLAACLTAPLAMGRDHHSNSRRYYDRTHKDYHQWNDNEDRSYSSFRTERHLEEHPFTRARRNEQQQYWNWRHEHPDDNKR